MIKRIVNILRAVEQTLVSFSLSEKGTKTALEKQYFHEILPDYFCQGLPGRKATLFKKKENSAGIAVNNVDIHREKHGRISQRDSIKTPFHIRHRRSLIFQKKKKRFDEYVSC